MLEELFRKLRSEGRKALLPFVTAGDPDLAFTAEVIRELAARGASAIEVGIPYSDPIADGPVIQASYTRALGQRVKLSDIFAMLAEVTRSVSTPVVVMVSYAIIFRQGPEKFVRMAKEAGIAGAIVPDLLVEESDAMAELCRREKFPLIQLVTPTTSRERALRIASQSTGFLYYVSVTGITGERTELPPDLLENVAWLRSQTDLPICIGFGISSPEHVRRVAPVADGVIVGSAIVRRMAEAATRPRGEVVREVGEFAASLAAALRD